MVTSVCKCEKDAFIIYYYPKRNYKPDWVVKSWPKIPKYLNVPFISQLTVSKPLFKITVDYNNLQVNIKVFCAYHAKKKIIDLILNKIYNNKLSLLHISTGYSIRHSCKNFITYSSWTYSKYIDWFFLEVFASVKLLTSTYIISHVFDTGFLPNWQIFWFLVKNHFVKVFSVVFNSYFVVFNFVHKILFNYKTSSISTFKGSSVSILTSVFVHIFKKKFKKIVRLNKFKSIRFFLKSLILFIYKRNYIFRRKYLLSFILLTTYKNFIFYVENKHTVFLFKASYLFWASFLSYIKWIKFIIYDDKDQVLDFKALLGNLFSDLNLFSDIKQSQTANSNIFFDISKSINQYEFRIYFKNVLFGLNYLYRSYNFIFNKNIRATLIYSKLRAINKGLYVYNLNTSFYKVNLFQSALISFVYKNNLAYFSNRKIYNYKKYMFKNISKPHKFLNITYNKFCFFNRKPKILFNFFNPHSHYCWYIDVDKHVSHINNKYYFLTTNSLL